VRVKICGLQQPEDAAVASAAGADLLGVIFAPARRRRTVTEARAIFAAAAPEAERVGVFVDAPLPEIQDVVAACRLDRVQLGGREAPELCAALGPRGIKTLRLPDDRDAFERYGTPLFHLDAARSGGAGGTGESWDYRLAREFTCAYSVLLAGGLTPENVVAAISAAHPWGVDVSSGVETNGVKDADKIVAFIHNARAGFVAISDQP